MRSKSGVVLLVTTGVLALTAIVVWIRGPGEPEHLGKPLSFWLKALEQGVNSGAIRPIDSTNGIMLSNSAVAVISPSPVEAIRAIGTNALPCLLAGLQERDSELKLILNRWLSHQHTVKKRFPLASETQRRALWGFVALSPEIFSVLPEMVLQANGFSVWKIDSMAFETINHLADAQGFRPVAAVGGEKPTPAASVWRLQSETRNYVIAAFWHPEARAFRHDMDSWFSAYLLTPEGMVLDQVTVGVSFIDSPFVWTTESVGTTQTIALRIPKGIQSPRLSVVHGKGGFTLGKSREPATADRKEEDNMGFLPTGTDNSDMSAQRFRPRGLYPNSPVEIEIRLRVSSGRFCVLDPDGVDVEAVPGALRPRAR